MSNINQCIHNFEELSLDRFIKANPVFNVRHSYTDAGYCLPHSFASSDIRLRNLGTVVDIWVDTLCQIAIINLDLKYGIYEDKRNSRLS